MIPQKFTRVNQIQFVGLWQSIGRCYLQECGWFPSKGPTGRPLPSRVDGFPQSCGMSLPLVFPNLYTVAPPQGHVQWGSLQLTGGAQQLYSQVRVHWQFFPLYEGMEADKPNWGDFLQVANKWIPRGGNYSSQRIVICLTIPHSWRFLLPAIRTQIACLPGRHFTNWAIFISPWNEYIALSMSLKIKHKENILLRSIEVDKRNKVEKWARNFGKFQLSHSFMKS